MTTNPSFLRNDYLGAFQIFKIAKFSKLKDPSDDDIESIMDFWCPMFETISPIKIGFLVVFVILSRLSSSLEYQSNFEVGYLRIPPLFRFQAEMTQNWSNTLIRDIENIFDQIWYL